MFKMIAHTNRAHDKAALTLAVRDQFLQYAAIVVLCGVCMLIGHGWFAAALLVLVTATEAAIKLLTRKKGPFAHRSKDVLLLWFMGLSAAKVLLYLSPAIVFIAYPLIPLKLLGILWLMTAQTYITHNWFRYPVLLYAMLAAAFIIMMIAFFKLTDVMHTVAPLGHWVIEGTFLAIYFYASISTLHQCMKRERALITAEKAASARLAQLEQSQRLDPLTGLLNRSAFDGSLAGMLQDRERTQTEVAVFLLDINNFKPVNDTYSHEAGDTVLIAVANRIRAHFGQAGLVARMGGDEFICALHQRGTDDETLAFADALKNVISQDIQWNGRKLRVTSSIGIAITGTGADAPKASVATLSAAADQAMYAAKLSPSGAAVIYRANLFRPRMTADDKQILIDSISNGTVRPYYQPKIHLTSEQIVGFEALARWHHPIRGDRHPKDFIEQIDDLGLQGDFMVSMAEQVFGHVQTLLDAGLDPGQISLNVSEVALATFSGRQDLHRIITAHPLVAKHMTFEITENVFIARSADAIQTSIETFRGLGVRISLDDFGTGFASFDHLRRLDFDELKIDTSFVAGLGHDSTSQVLVQGFLDIASGLGLGVVAEGVETQTQRQELTNMGCVVAQGYLFSAAIPIEAATKMLKKQQTT